MKRRSHEYIPRTKRDFLVGESRETALIVSAATPGLAALAFAAANQTGGVIMVQDMEGGRVDSYPREYLPAQRAYETEAERPVETEIQ